MNRQELVTKLELVGRALADDNLVPIFRCFCFNGTTVSAYNDALGIITPCETDGAFAVDGKTLLGLLKNSTSEAVEFKLETEELVVKADRSTFKLPYLAESEFLFEEPKAKWAVTLPLNERVLKGLSACLLTSSKDNAQPALMGVCLHSSNKEMFLYSCDGDALSRCNTGAKSRDQSEPDYLMPNAFCEAVLKIAADTKATEGNLSTSHEWATADTDTGYVVFGRLIEYDTPLDHAELIKSTLEAKHKFVAVPDDLHAALSRARVVADPESAKTLLSVEAGRLKLLTTTHMGVVRDTLAFGDKQHYEVEANVSAELVQRSISLCKEMAITDKCSAFRDEYLLQIISNMT